MLVSSPLDLQQNELRQPRVHNLASAPSTPVKGQLWFDSTNNILKWWDGTQWISAIPGSAASDATTTSKGIVQLAGDLTGTAASPQIATGVITDNEVASAHLDGAAATYSMRRLGYGANNAMPGTALLNQLGLPTGAVNVNNQQITNLAAPSAATDAANKQYVDSAAEGLDAKASVKAATTVNIAATGTQTIDGVALIVGDRCLVKNQTSADANGIYVVASGSWTRATDANTWAELPGAYVWVEQGTTQADTGWVCTSDQGGTLGSTAVNWTQFSGAGSIVDGAGLLKTGNTLDVRVDGTTIAITGDFLGMVPGAISTMGGATYYSSATHGAGTTISIPKTTHGCRASRGLIVQCRLEATGEEITVDNTVAASGDVTVTFATSQGANTVRTTIIG